MLVAFQDLGLGLGGGGQRAEEDTLDWGNQGVYLEEHGA